MNEMDINKIISRNICSNMDRLGMSQEELAKRVGASQSSVSNWCLGSKIPRMNKIDKMCEVFGIKRSQLMGIQDTTVIDTNSSKERMRLASMINELSDDQIRKVITFIEMIR